MSRCEALVELTVSGPGGGYPSDLTDGQWALADARDGEPSAGPIDSQSARTADTVPAATRGFDAGEKVTGRKRFIVTDTLGLLLAVHALRRASKAATEPSGRCREPGFALRPADSTAVWRRLSAHLMNAITSGSDSGAM